jgi:hypothetical protein
VVVWRQLDSLAVPRHKPLGYVDAEPIPPRSTGLHYRSRAAEHRAQRPEALVEAERLCAMPWGLIWETSGCEQAPERERRCAV